MVLFCDCLREMKRKVYLIVSYSYIPKIFWPQMKQLISKKCCLMLHSAVIDKYTYEKVKFHFIISCQASALAQLACFPIFTNVFLCIVKTKSLKNNFGKIMQTFSIQFIHIRVFSPRFPVRTKNFQFLRLIAEINLNLLYSGNLRLIEFIPSIELNTNALK